MSSKKKTIKDVVKVRKAHITGSVAYGVPKADSDIDLVILVSDDEWDALVQWGDSVGSKTSKGASIRYGRLNVIATTNKRDYDQWVKGTSFLKSIAPVSKEIACLMFERVFHASR